MNHLWPAHPTSVIHTKGTDFEIGHKHAELLGGKVQDGMVGFYRDFWHRLLNNRPKSFPQNVVAIVLQKLVDPGLVNQLIKQVPPYFMERISGVAEGAGLSFRDFLTPLVLPDLLPVLQAYAGRLGAVNFIDVSPPPLFGCSSFVHNGINFLQGRNLDFPGVGYWDRYPVIQMMEPKNTLRYIGFGTAGVPLAGITGVNEAQISVALHQHYCFETNLKGYLPFVIGEEILRNARSLNEALEILSRFKVASSWAFVVADGKTRRAFIYETHPKAAGIRWLDEKNKTLTHSNFYQTVETAAKEYATTERMIWDNYSRSNRLRNIIELADDNFDVAKAVKAISDHWDPYWGTERIMNRTVSQIFNVQSLVWDLENMKVYFAEGNAPVHLGRFFEYDMGAIFSGHGGRTGKSFEGYVFSKPNLLEAKKSFIHSFIHSFEGKMVEARSELVQTLGFEDFPEARLISGLIAMKEGDFQMASDMLSAAKKHIERDKAIWGKSYFPPEYFEVWLYWARSLDLLGKRGEALKQYSEIEAHPDLRDTVVKRIASAKKCYRKEELDRIMMPYSSYLPFS
jgi:hypothetical protein